MQKIFDKEVLGDTNDKKFAEQERDEKAAISASKSEELNQATDDLQKESEDKASDEEFLNELTGQCEEKAHQFDQRSQARAGELTALSQATEVLEEGAADNYKANKKLVGLQKESSSPVAFVQINSVQEQQAKAMLTLNGQAHHSIQRVMSFLDTAAVRIDSRLLSTLSVRVKVAEDHFVKVRGLIKDLIAKLEKQAEEEAQQKSFCDDAMKKAISGRDEANSKIEAANAEIATLTSRKQANEEEIETKQGEIAEMTKALNEATELRQKEHEDNVKTIGMAMEGKHAVETALEILQSFYGGGELGLLQTKYVPPNADREGNTVGDLAPDTFEGEYKGAEAESKGILGILEIVLADFDRTITKTKEEEDEAQTKFEEFEKETHDSINEKEKRVKELKDENAEIEANLLTQETTLSDAKKSLEASLDELKDLESQCVAPEETWEERRAKRKAEVEALKEALSILEDAFTG